jgi:hypothetical protein
MKMESHFPNLHAALILMLVRIQHSHEWITPPRPAPHAPQIINTSGIPSDTPRQSVYQSVTRAELNGLDPEAYLRARC